jgi:hypothetical protein
MFSFLRRTSLYILAIPFLFTFLGAASNQSVLLANHDTFPVMVNDRKLADMADHDKKSVEIKFNQPNPAEKQDDVVMLDDTHCVMTSHTHLNALADIFDMKDAIYSIGDFSLMLGDWLWAFAPFLFAFDVIRKLKAQA